MARDEEDLATKRARAAALRLRSIPPSTDLKAVVVALMEALAEVRGQLDAYDPSGELRKRYERFRLALEQAGFPVQHTTRLARASAHRRLGQLAEARGDRDAAALHYDLAIRARRDVGCARRLTRIHRYLEARATRQG